MPLLTLYLGIYNGEKYLGSLFDQIQAQDNQNFKILVVDNNSLNVRKEMFKEWKIKYKSNFQFVKNKVNYGGHGSLFKNIDKIKTPWFCTLHQDDYYKPNHVGTIIQLISKSAQNTVGVSTTMGSMSASGKTMNSKPRANWFSENLDQPGQFLQNLRSQAFPFPAAAFKLSVFKRTEVPFHNAAFSDTEQTLKMLAHGIFVYSDKETMHYRENPNSESHVLNDEERIIGATIGLSRIFCSKEFEVVLNKIDKHKRGLFADQLLKALPHRIPKSSSLDILKNLALEQMITKWGYSEKIVAQLLGNNYAAQYSKQTVEVINNLSGTTIKTIKFKNRVIEDNVGARIWFYYFNSRLFQRVKLNKKVLMNIYKILFVVKPNHRLKNKWN